MWQETVHSDIPRDLIIEKGTVLRHIGKCPLGNIKGMFTGTAFTIQCDLLQYLLVNLLIVRWLA
jgi:hypothetical protein